MIWKKRVKNWKICGFDPLTTPHHPHMYIRIFSMTPPGYPRKIRVLVTLFRRKSAGYPGFSQTPIPHVHDVIAFK